MNRQSQIKYTDNFGLFVVRARVCVWKRRNRNDRRNVTANYFIFFFNFWSYQFCDDWYFDTVCAALIDNISIGIVLILSYVTLQITQKGWQKTTKQNNFFFEIFYSNFPFAHTHTNTCTRNYWKKIYLKFALFCKVRCLAIVCDRVLEFKSKPTRIKLNALECCVELWINN